jgi:hypothetical protein
MEDPLQVLEDLKLLIVQGTQLLRKIHMGKFPIVDQLQEMGILE